MTPMERFATLSPANDPCPWEGRKMMTEIGLEEGSMEMRSARVHATAVVYATRKCARLSALAFAGSR